MFKCIWKARNEYIQVLLYDDKEHLQKFFYTNSKRVLTDEECMICIKLMEMQKYAMLMYTSCGWFFSDISGIETLQILQYAARAIEYAKEITGDSIEEEFIKRISIAKSNKGEEYNGDVMYKNEVLKKNILKQ
ncbi:MAG: DUF3536 domain-containing protein [Ignavibacteria bacterium]